MAKTVRNRKVVRSATDAPGRLDFNVWRGRPGRMRRAHRHADIEFNYVLRGHMTYELAGRRWRIGPRRLSLFWAGAPHELVQIAPRTEAYWIVLPLAWLVQWQLSAGFVQRLLSGEPLEEPDRAAARLDEVLLGRWANDLRAASGPLRSAALLEIEARCKRLAWGLLPDAARPRTDATAASQVERLAAYAAEHYPEVINVTDIAAGVGLHPNYAMALFKNACGISIWEYVTRLRVSHAQRLLLATDWKVQRVALDSGFASSSSFYGAFTRVSGCTPTAYRRRSLLSASRSAALAADRR